MALNKDNVGVAITGAISVGDLGATAPTSQSSALAAHTDLGYISEDGITETLPPSGEREKRRAWQNQDEIRTLGTPAEDNPTWQFTMVEVKKETIELHYGTSVTQTATEGSFVINTNELRDHKSFVIDVVDGDELERIYIPDGEVVEVGERTLVATDVYGYQVTVEAHFDSTIDGNAKVWSTRLKSAA